MQSFIWGPRVQLRGGCSASARRAGECPGLAALRGTCPGDSDEEAGAAAGALGRSQLLPLRTEVVLGGLGQLARREAAWRTSEARGARCLPETRFEGPH